jgi:hemerythrin-like domain-containing protein
MAPETFVHVNRDRRNLLRDSLALSVALGTTSVPIIGEAIRKSSATEKQDKEPEVSATEDLMREHGVIRRALLVYIETVPKLRQNASNVNPAALRQTAQLFRTVGEDYHEKLLEEQHIFPVIREHGGELHRYADILTDQHKRGREITDYVLAVTNASKVSTGHAEPLANVLEGLVLMYQNHAAREDTIVFPAWKKKFTDKQLDEIADQFEDIEHKMFGNDGFQDAEKKIAGIEAELGLTDLAQFTPPPPPTP